MNKEKIIFVAVVLLTIISVVSLCLSMFGDKSYGNDPLNIALICVIVSNLLVVYSYLNKKKDNR